MLHDYSCSVIGLQQDFVSSEESPDELQNGDFNGEVKGRDDGHGPERKPEPSRHLPFTIPGHSEAPGSEPGIVSSEIFQKMPGDVDFSIDLFPRLRQHCLNQSNKVLVDFGLLHQMGSLAENLSPLPVSLWVFEGIVHACLVALLD